MPLVLLSSFAACSSQSRDASPDARILYYRERLGGPSTYPAHARLGLALAEKARATGNVAYYLDAARHLERSLSMQRNYEALAGLSGVSLALHRFPEALAYAREAAVTAPGDPAAHAALFDALLGSGDDRAAETVLESMTATPDFGYLVRRAALLERRGAGADALRTIEQACERSAAEPAPARAWCQVRLGALQLTMCEPGTARESYERALSILPGYFLAEEHLAELDAGEGNAARAMGFYEARVAAGSEPRYRLVLADLYDAAGRREQAAEQRRLARNELLQRAAQDIRDAWHELALLEAADPGTAAEAIGWAEKDWQNRKDARAAETLAWARSQHGELANVATLDESAAVTGSGSATGLLRAAIVRSRAGRVTDARALLDRALACPSALTPHDRRLARQAEDEMASRLRDPGETPAR